MSKCCNCCAIFVKSHTKPCSDPLKCKPMESTVYQGRAKSTSYTYSLSTIIGSNFLPLKAWICSKCGYYDVQRYNKEYQILSYQIPKECRVGVH